MKLKVVDCINIKEIFQMNVHQNTPQVPKLVRASHAQCASAVAAVTACAAAAAAMVAANASTLTDNGICAAFTKCDAKNTSLVIEDAYKQNPKLTDLELAWVLYNTEQPIDDK